MHTYKPLRTVVVVALSLLIILTPLLSSQEAAANASVNIKQLTTRMEQAAQSKKWNMAATYAKQIAVYYDQARKYYDAAHYYDLTARYWEAYGQPNWGIVNTIRADHVRTVVDTYIEVRADQDRELEKFEPLAGVYAGLYPAGSEDRGDPRSSLEAMGQKHALYLTYAHWRRGYPETESVFPIPYAERAIEAGGALQVAWEPSNGLSDVKDDAYVRQFAREANALGVPIFLRFAGEMNGEWVPWYDDPETYIEKFRLIHDIMEEEAPNVAMVWSPNFLPRHNIAPYYPGDDYVDWVGFSLYTIPYSQGEEKLGGNPIDYLYPLYQQYAHKPIMISEGAVSFMSYELQRDYTEWALGQLDNMYAYMPRIFSQVKAITYFNLDKMTTNYDNQNNNYDLYAREEMLSKYKKLIAKPYYVKEVKDGATNRRSVQYIPLSEHSGTKGQVQLFTYVKLPLGQQPYAVHLYDGDGKLLKRAYAAPFDMSIDFSQLPQSGKLIVKVLDETFKVLHTQDIPYQQ